MDEEKVDRYVGKGFGCFMVKVMLGKFIFFFVNLVGFKLLIRWVSCVFYSDLLYLGVFNFLL